VQGLDMGEELRLQALNNSYEKIEQFIAKL